MPAIWPAPTRAIRNILRSPFDLTPRPPSLKRSQTRWEGGDINCIGPFPLGRGLGVGLFVPYVLVQKGDDAFKGFDAVGQLGKSVPFIRELNILHHAAL